MKHTHQIIYLIGELGDGGQERQMYYLLKLFDKKKYQPAVVVWHFNPHEKYKQELLDMGVQLYDFFQYKTRFKKWYELRKLRSTSGCKIMHSYAFFLNFFGWSACLFSDTRFFGALRSNFNRLRREQPFHVIFFNLVLPTYIISNNYLGARELSEYVSHFFMKKEVIVIPNKIDLSQFPLNGLHNAKEKRLTTVSIGTIISIKRIDLLVLLTKKLRQRGLDVQHIHAGVGPQMPVIQALIEQEKLQEYFFLAGSITNVANFLSKADLLIHTSEQEGSPNVVLEAMAAGKPVVTTDCGDVNLLIENGVNGFVVNINDQKDLLEKTVLLLTNNALRQTIGLANRKKVENEMEAGQMLAEIFSIYDTYSDKISTK
jgi:glycosyltransferase involved in cell wall biosynthesis